MTDQIEMEKTPFKKLKADKRPWGIFIILLFSILLIAVLAYGYVEIGKMNVALAQQVAHLQNQTTSTQSTIAALQQSVTALEQAAEKSQTLSAQQEKMIGEWEAAQKGDFKKWTIAEAQYLVKLANDHLQFTHENNLALILLQRAAQMLQNLQDPHLLDLQKSLASDMLHLQANTEIDITALYLRLTAVDNQLDQLPLPVNPLTVTGSETITALPPGAPWWQVGWHYSWQALKKIVIIKNMGNNGLPLVLPDEKLFLYQNLHAQMEMAMWAALHRKMEIYQLSLAQTMAWVERYFAQEAPETKTMLQTLQDLRRVNVQPATINLADTLTLFNTVLAQMNTAKAAQ